MKNKVFRWFIKILGLSAFGLTVTACYAAPYGEYEVKGKVVDEDLKPIEGILVSGQDYLFKADIDSLIREGEDPKAFHMTTTTGEDGTFTLEDAYWPDPKVYAIDIDGEENGSFEKTEKSFEFVQIEEGGSGFYEGSYSAKNVLIVMKTKEQD